MTPPTLQWSEEEPPVEVESGEQLERLLDRLQAECSTDFPIAVRLQAHGFELDLLLGTPDSFVYLNDTGNHRYRISVGDASAGGVVAFYLLGQHHTEFDRRHLIPLAAARHAARKFFDSGHLPLDVKWEESFY